MTDKQLAVLLGNIYDKLHQAVDELEDKLDEKGISVTKRSMLGNEFTEVEELRPIKDILNDLDSDVYDLLDSGAPR